MTALQHKDFTGEFPRLNAYDLPPGAAQSATNVDFTQGNLQGIKSRTAVAGITAPGAKSLFIYDSLAYSYYSWARDVDAVRGPITDDAYARFYWADGSNFYVSRGDLGGSGGEPSATNRYWVGVPEPTTPLTFSAEETKFTISGYRPVLYSIFGEGTDGSRKNEVTLDGGAFTTDNLNSCQIEANASINLDDLNANVEVPTTSVVGYDELGNPITDTTTTSQAPSVTYKLAVEVRFITETGYLSAILRMDTNKNTYPAEMSGLTGSFTFSGNSLSVGLRTRSDYREARAYTYTYVNQYGEEGPPAKPLQIDILEGQTVKLGYTPPGAHSYCPITRIRVYRTATGGTSTEYLFVGEVTVSTTSPVFEDAVKGSALGESIQTRDFYPPPQNLRGIVAMPGGVLAGFVGNTVYLSQPYLPYAWKPSTTQTLENRVIGHCPYENGLYVTTTAHPVLITGYSPETMSSQKIPAIQAGVSKGSMCNAGPFAVYASHDGLVALRGINASLDLSFKFFTRAQWRNLYANKLHLMHLNAHDGHLLAWFEDGTPGFLIRLDEVSPSFTKVTDPVYCALVHPQTDNLYVGAGSSIYAFKTGGSGQAWTHWGKDYILPKQENLGAVQFVGGGTLTFTVYADGTQVFQTLVTMNESGSTVIRLPSGFRARRWSFKMDGQVDSYVYEMNVVTSPAELQGV
ncbi:hypothetical protein [Flavobacterium sp.]|jgi:hypothetical protein|uniref:hypothetical protein n=1 Tax=Flavobacterium sp. TaxID=239 RepID=UPI0037C15491